ncbi:MAG: endonuclease/exonuclease/phosphatase family protein [Myxococcota bacterium]
MINSRNIHSRGSLPSQSHQIGTAIITASILICSGIGCTGTESAEVDSARDRSVALQGRDFTLLTWNCFNLFDEFDDPAKSDDLASAAEVESKLDALGKVLRRANADVVLLQEVEHNELLTRLATGPLAGMGYVEWGLFEGSDPRGIDVAFISKLPTHHVGSHLGERFPNESKTRFYHFARDALEIAVSPAGAPILLVNLHLRSMINGGDDHRLAEAMYVRSIVEGHLRNGREHIVVAGDLNDLPDSSTLKALTAGETLGSVTETVDLKETWTYFRYQTQLDYILASKQMLRRLDVDGVTILRNPEVRAASDHAAVVARFSL